MRSMPHHALQLDNFRSPGMPLQLQLQRAPSLQQVLQRGRHARRGSTGAWSMTPLHMAARVELAKATRSYPTLRHRKTSEDAGPRARPTTMTAKWPNIPPTCHATQIIAKHLPEQTASNRSEQSTPTHTSIDISPWSLVNRTMVLFRCPVALAA